MGTGQYILIGRKAVAIADSVEWAKWFQSNDRRVAEDLIGGLRISTVFLGLDHRWGNGPPQIFETMVFDIEPTEHDWSDLGLGVKLIHEAHEDYTQRYATWEEAEEGHRDVCAQVRRTFIRRVV